MKRNRLALLGIAFGIAGAALLALFVSTSGSTADVPTAQVLVAPDAGIASGSAADGLAQVAVVREVPVDVVPARAIADPAELAGQRAVRAVGPGEILTTDQFAAPGPAVGGFIVPEGWEAVSVEAAPAPGLQGYATPGSLVNLYLTTTEPAPAVTDPAAPAAAARTFTQLVMAHTEVLAVTRGTLTGESQQVAEGVAAPGVFLLQVRPADVPALLFAEQQGELWFSLANEEDPAPTAERFYFDGLAPDAVNAAIGAARAQLEADRAAAEAAAAASTGEGTDEGTGEGETDSAAAEGGGS